MQERRDGAIPLNSRNEGTKEKIEMKKKMLVAALALTASIFATTNVFAQTACSSGVTIQFNGVGSSAQANSFAQAARALTQSGSSYNLLSTSKGAVVTDARPSTPVSDSANPFWVIWDSNANCNVYAYWTIDSGAGVKDFFAYQKFTASANANKVYTALAGSYGQITTSSITTSTENQVGGLPDTVGPTDPGFLAIVAKLNVTPQQRVNVAGNQPAPGYCGNLTTTSTGYLTQWQCYFNVGATDIRPEDALYATTRALTSYSGYTIAASGSENAVTKVGTGQLTGLGYNTAGNGTCTGSATVGCTIKDAFNQGKAFNVVKFALSGSDPIGLGTEPAYTTLSTGAEPVLVFAHNGTVFGTTSGGTYVYNDINKEILAQVFSGWIHCTGDLLTTGAPGPGSPIQVVEREPLSGTYNTFEFTAVRTLAGSSNPFFAPTGTGTSLPPESNAYNGQEQFNDPAALPGGNGTACPLTGGYPQANCFNPFFFVNPNNECPGTASNLPVRLRAIGTGEEVKSTVGTYNSGAGAATVDNSLGYSFWGYGNFQPLCNTTGGTTTCPGSYIGHYLTVDAIDPLFTTEGGALDSTPNPAGAYNPPYCNVNGVSQTCFAIPFTHIKDGKYPLWSLLRIVTFAPVAAKVETWPAVLNMVAQEQIQTASDGLSDFVPFLTNLTGGSGVWTGDLNLFVYRSHFKQTGGTVTPANGHKACGGVFTGVSLQGGNHTSSACLVDFGSDVGGSVLTVQSDVDWISDWSTEEFGVHQ
jgi:hypothetical protein